MYWYPTPLDPADAARWKESARRHRMLDGCWEEDALDREADFFAPEVRMFLPAPELSRNPFSLVMRQVSMLYDEDPVVSAAGISDEATLDPILTPQLWPLCQRRHFYANGLGECLMRLDVDNVGKRIAYRVVPPDLVECEASKDDPAVPALIREHRPRRDPVSGREEWTVETWDVRNPAAPTFQIEALDEQGRRSNRTDTYAPEAKGAYPYMDGETGVLPYVLWHAEVQNSLWNPARSMELVEGTLTTSALWTMWVAGVRDGAHPQRYIVNGEVKTTKTTLEGNVAVEWVRMNPITILQVKQPGDKPVQMGQFQPAMDPKSSGEAISDFEAGLAVYAGLSPADLQRTQTGASGYSLVVSREGLRRAQRRQVSPARLGDVRMLSTAARLANTHLGTSLPTDEAAWTVQYADIGQSAEERRALVEEVKALLEAGLIGPVDAMLKLNPGMSEEAAIQKLAQIADTKRAVAALAAPTVPPPAELVATGPKTAPTADLE